ncbi:unnamed protein product [Nippostrongylus brasiliensis]|uniref:Uncharacterized protein n=1 Tax=Nippostrongylus brasiliensis TaxID=27835 RepID=A0A0N4XIL4_NIPBR|nr:unnamed protein product [Nippostrongylus brasiliensis]
MVIFGGRAEIKDKSAEIRYKIAAASRRLLLTRHNDHHRFHSLRHSETSSKDPEVSEQLDPSIYVRQGLFGGGAGPEYFNNNHNINQFSPFSPGMSLRKF